MTLFFFFFFLRINVTTIPKMTKVKPHYLQLWVMATRTITWSRQVSAWIRRRRWNLCSVSWNRHLDCPKFWFHDNKRPCSFKRFAVKNQQCKKPHHLYKVGESNSRKHVLLHQEKDVNSICVGYVIQVEWEKKMAKFIEKHWTVVLHMKWGLLR